MLVVARTHVREPRPPRALFTRSHVRTTRSTLPRLPRPAAHPFATPGDSEGLRRATVPVDARLFEHRVIDPAGEQLAVPLDVQRAVVQGTSSIENEEQLVDGSSELDVNIEH